MKHSIKNKILIVVIPIIVLGGCVPVIKITRTENKSVPASYIKSQDTTSIANIRWKEYFNDDNLVALIDTALKNNQELNITLQEIEISKNEIRARKGEYLPFVGLNFGAGIDRAGKYTWRGTVEENVTVTNGPNVFKSSTDFMIGPYASWEIDVWKRLRNTKKSAVLNYLASTEGRNFMKTNIIAEIAGTYYELMALDNLLEIIEQNIHIQANALNIAKQQKNAARLTQLAVNRFEAQLLNTQNRQFIIKQRIIESESRISFLTGKFPGIIKRSSDKFLDLKFDSIGAGIPSQLLYNRPDIRKAEYEFMAAKIDVKVAKARFFPNVRLKAGLGFQAFNTEYILNPESMLYTLTGDLVSPLINRNAIKAAYNSATTNQIRAAYLYEQTILNAYVDVLNELSKIDNFTKSFETKSKEVEILMQSVMIANSLFNFARADYAEVLLTQREALESKMDLVEIKLKQLKAWVNNYRALGGGWK